MTSGGARAAAPPAPSRPKGGRPQGAGSGGARGHSVRAADRHPVARVDGRAGQLRQDLVVLVATACGVSRPSWPPSTIICNFAMRPVRPGRSFLLAWLDRSFAGDGPCAFLQRHGIASEVVGNPGRKCFQVELRRWKVEQTFGRLQRYQHIYRERAARPLASSVSVEYSLPCSLCHVLDRCRRRCRPGRPPLRGRRRTHRRWSAGVAAAGSRQRRPPSSLPQP